MEDPLYESMVWQEVYLVGLCVSWMCGCCWITGVCIRMCMVVCVCVCLYQRIVCTCVFLYMFLLVLIYAIITFQGGLNFRVSECAKDHSNLTLTLPDVRASGTDLITIALSTVPQTWRIYHVTNGNSWYA